MIKQLSFLLFGFIAIMGMTVVSLIIVYESLYGNISIYVLFMFSISFGFSMVSFYFSSRVIYYTLLEIHVIRELKRIEKDISYTKSVHEKLINELQDMQDNAE